MNDEYNNNHPGENMGGNDNPINDYPDNSLSQSEDHKLNNSLNQSEDHKLNNSLNQSENQNYDNSLNQNKDENFDYSYSTGSFYSNNNKSQTDSQTIDNEPIMTYPITVENEDKKPKRKRKFGVFKLTAAALAFGLIAGAAFQGYYTVMNVTGNTTDTSSQSSVKASEVSKDSDSSDTIVPTTSSSSDAVVTDVSEIVSNVMPSIVAINCKATTTSTDIFGREYSEQSDGSGSGIIIGQNDSKLLIVTNNHVINGATAVEVVFANNKTATAEIKGSDANADLAVLSVKMSDLSEETVKAIKVATLGDSDKVEAGDMAIAIGNALGYGQSVTVGYISAVNREVTIDSKTMTLLQTDAAINPGNSGGALINTQGQVIGINSVKYASEEVEGMGYSIPISSAIPMINELMNRQAVSAGEQGYLGINADSAQNVTKDYSERFNMPVGVYINDVIENSPAAKAGLEQGNIITGVDDVSISTIDDLVNVLSYKKEGQKIDLKIQVKTNGAYVEKTLKVTLGSRN